VTEPSVQSNPAELSSERIETIDALRGLALLGILIVNITNLAGPLLLGELDNGLWGLIRFAFVGKFYPIFAFLFGLGLQLQYARSAHAARPRAYLSRRLWILFALGALHSIFVWTGDILTSYAVIGLIWLQLTRLKGWVSLVLVVIAFVASARLEFALVFYNGVPNSERIYSEGFAAITQYRFEEWLYLLRLNLRYAGEILMLFWLGGLVGRNPYLLQHRAILTAVFVLTFPLGLWLNRLPVIRNDYIPLVGSVLAFGYIAGFCLLVLKHPYQTWTHRLAQTGRMPLSNYLGQSVVSTLVFYGYGLDLYSQWSLGQALLYALALYAAQVALSNWWLSHFRHGPMEWVWRCLAYGRMLPIKQ
jgi:uncharacterized protein